MQCLTEEDVDWYRHHAIKAKVNNGQFWQINCSTPPFVSFFKQHLTAPCWSLKPVLNGIPVDNNYVEAFKPGADHSVSKNDEMFLSEIFFMRGRDVLVFLKKWTKLCVKMLMKWYEPYETRSTQIPVCRLVGSFCASHDVCKSLWKASWTFACRKAEKPSTSFHIFFGE